MSTLKQFGAPLALALSLIAVPTYAASLVSTADLNGDGVPDRVVLASPPETTIVVRVSGSEPQILKASGAVTQVVMVDVDGDGDLDLASFGPGSNLIIWLNIDSHGRFESAKKRPGPQGFALSRNLIVSSSDHCGGLPVASPTSVGRPAHLASVHTIVPPFDYRFRFAGFLPGSPIDTARTGVSRAPPFNRGIANLYS